MNKNKGQWDEQPIDNWKMLHRSSWPLTCDDDLDEVSILQLVVVCQALQQQLWGGLMSEQQNLLADAHHAAVWSLNTQTVTSRDKLNLKLSEVLN